MTSSDQEKKSKPKESGLDIKSENSTKLKSSAVDVLREATIPDPALVSNFQNCTISFQSEARPKAEWKKPLWLSGYPGSGNGMAGNKGSGDLWNSLINGITGIKGGVKSFHAKSKTVKRCKSSLSKTVACAQSHPIVGVGPEKQTANFQSTVIFVIRNFKQAWPGFLNDKAIMYHRLPNGQVKEEEWCRSRDNSLPQFFYGWKQMILEWKQNLPSYHIGLYVSYDELLDPRTGPALTVQLAQQLKLAGFPVAPTHDELGCIWYRTVEPEWTRLTTSYYANYTPGYTEEQKQFLLAKLDTFRKELSSSNDSTDKDDTTEELVRILNSYYDDVRDNTRIDKPAEAVLEVVHAE